MLAREDQYIKAYEAVKEELLSQTELERKIPIFVSIADCDSICALRILVDLLRSDGIHYSIFPVSGWIEVQEKVKNELAEKEELVNCFFINCGATEDLMGLLELESDNQRVLVIDSHRPIHTSNASELNGQVIVLVADNEEETPTDLGDIDSDDDEEEDESDDEEEDSEGPPLQRQRVGEETDVARKIARQRERRRARKEALQRRIEYYDRGAWRGQPAACIAYEFCRQLHKEDNHLLWLSIIGLTDQLVHELISPTNYQAVLHGCRQQVMQLGNMEMPHEVELEEGIRARVPLHRRISEVKDLRFTLMRHWTLIDSMINSPYVASRLQTWRDAGRKNLEMLLAKMGCSLAQCGQHYVHMKPEIKEQLESKLLDSAPAYNLPDLQFDSFQMEQGFKTALSASDVVHAVTAILEYQISEEADAKGNFWRAYKALGPNAYTELVKGIELAKKVYKTILEDGGSAVARKIYKNMNTLRYIDMSAGEVSDRKLMSQPLALLKMAIFMQDAFKVMTMPPKPVVMVGPADADNKCLLVGYTGRPKLTDVNGNRFGLAFASAQEATKSAVLADAFDQYAIKVPKEDVARFLASIDQARFMQT